MHNKLTNIFLTGDLHVGKSTVVKHVLNDIQNCRVGGYTTEPIFQKGRKVGFKMVSFSGEEEIIAHENFQHGEKFGEFRVNLDAFEQFGVRILTQALSTSQLIVMDEIGAMERYAQKFQKAVEECINSTIAVFGVFQKRANWIRTLLTNRNDTAIYPIDLQTRALIEPRIKKQLKQILKIY